MPHTSEIEKLEQRFRENSKGRTFAPLADAYRKAGLIDNAIELCQEGLKHHPDYISAWIVYGRCLLDKKDLPAAEDVYKNVLSLDPENVLALRTLADVSERANRLDATMEWLNRLLQADPMNGDAAEALARVKSKAAAAAKTPEPTAPVKPVASAQAPPPPPPPPPRRTPTPASPAARPAAVRPAPAPAANVAPPKLEIERASPDEATAVPLDGRPAGDLETFDGALDFDEVAHEAAKADGLEVHEDVKLQAERIEVEGLARTQYEGSGMFQLDHLPSSVPEPAESEEPSPSVDLPLIMPEDIEVRPRAAPPRAAPPPAPTPPPPPPSSPPAAAQAPPPPRVRARLADDDGAADRTALSQVEPVLTETMAELYLKQGHKEDALRVYRALLLQRPGDRRLHNKVDALEGRRRASGQSAAAFLRHVFHAGAGAGVPHGLPPSTTDAQVSALVAGAFEQAPDEPMPGEPTKPAEDTISLDSVFGDAEPGSGSPAPGMGATGPEPGRTGAGGQAAASGDGGAPQTGSFSFDEFFSAAGASAGGGGGSQTPRTSGRQARPPVEDEGDADQFQDWLKKLKS
ncbi:MAG TPA: tetratricopeptide repeat protein [Gemmatimonadales bacterium]